LLEKLEGELGDLLMHLCAINGRGIPADIK
jgi:hypothetical protein